VSCEYFRTFLFLLVNRATEHAKNVNGFAINGVDVLGIVRHTKLLAFRFDRHEPYAWPKLNVRR